MSKRARREITASKRPKTKLGLPDLDHSEAAVLDSLTFARVQAEDIVSKERVGDDASACIARWHHRLE